MLHVYKFDPLGRTKSILNYGSFYFTTFLGATLVAKTDPFIILNAYCNGSTNFPGMAQPISSVERHMFKDLLVWTLNNQHPQQKICYWLCG